MYNLVLAGGRASIVQLPIHQPDLRHRTPAPSQRPSQSVSNNGIFKTNNTLNTDLDFLTPPGRHAQRRPNLPVQGRLQDLRKAPRGNLPLSMSILTFHPFNTG